MKKIGRLTLNDFKAKADKSNLVESLEAIQGGKMNQSGLQVWQLIANSRKWGSR